MTHPETGYPLEDELLRQLAEAGEMARVAAKWGCIATLKAQRKHLTDLKRLADAFGKTATDTVIVLINTHDENGGPIAHMIRPGHHWDYNRVPGTIPYARDLAPRNDIGEMLELFDPEAALKLRDMTDQKLPIVVIDHGVAEIFTT
ncbi:MAG: hypothetical protein AAB421_02570 [Patescibacteria group bacterium]